MEPIENNPPPTEIPPAPPVPGETPPPAPPGAPPPAADLVINGEVTDERILAAQRAQRDAEFRAAELEAENQRLKEIQTSLPAPPPTPPAKPKKRWQFSPIIGADENETD